MTVWVRNAQIFHAGTRGFVPGELWVRDGKFISAPDAAPDTVIDAGGEYVIPGLVDVHTHGRAGGDFVSAEPEKLREMARSYLASGVTSLMPTLASAPLGELYLAIDRLRAAQAETGGARFLGIHLEGRYLNPKRRGAHAPELLFAPDAKEVSELLSRMGTPAHVSAALELDEDGSFARAVTGAGATLSLGHTDATYAQAMQAFSRGATAVTHLYNCMPPLHHREGGAVCAALTAGVYCELIADGFHISPGMIALAYRAAGEGKFVLITDSMEATGCPDGEYSIAGMPVTVKDGRAVTHDGAIAGSTLSLFDGVKNLTRFAGVSFGEAVYAATAAPAGEIGMEALVGSLCPGAYADFLTVDPESLALTGVYLGGEREEI